MSDVIRLTREYFTANFARERSLLVRVHQRVQLQVAQAEERFITHLAGIRAFAGVRFIHGVRAFVHDQVGFHLERTSAHFARVQRTVRMSGFVFAQGATIAELFVANATYVFAAFARLLTMTRHMTDELHTITVHLAAQVALERRVIRMD